ncbi:simple sugar transport system ATP-binding protein [Candidatus Hakubella thermalkaliphila]|uniref:Simple sugar transport system ATP-binding protein n=1 Tax=Candidatus Hakubella thermalkaliphila TaxID=2754717 RepID=A0A6V8NYR7_9ACTN|nr:simple sugar transport system ATP-binding protein [Candidatus Hakubella thermalkaliphila]
MHQDQYLVEMIKIRKKFGEVQALKDVDFTVRRREIVGLLGDNGAGKSTLVKILTGIFPPDEGEIYFEGERVNFSSPRQARKMGIETVYQDLSLINLMNISRNFFLGREPVRKIGLFGLLDMKKMNNECKKELDQIGIRVRSTNEHVAVLSGGERQAVSIGRCMYFGVKLLVLDEPLTSLSVREQRTVLGYMERARELGASLIFISHNVHHVYPVADRFVFLDKGVKIGERIKKEVSADDVTEIICSGKATAKSENPK